MKGVNLYINSKTKDYYYFTEFNVICYKCNDDLSEVVILQHTFTRKHFIEKKFCLQCYKKVEHGGVVDEYKLCHLIFELDFDTMPDLVPVFRDIPVLVNRRGYSIFEIQEIIKDSDPSCEIINNAKLTGRKNYTFSISPDEKRKSISVDEFHSSDAKKEVLTKTLELESPLEDDNELDKFFTNLKGSKILLPEEKKRLENDRSETK